MDYDRWKLMTPEDELGEILKGRCEDCEYPIKEGEELCIDCIELNKEQEEEDGFWN